MLCFYKSKASCFFFILDSPFAKLALLSNLTFSKKTSLVCPSEMQEQTFTFASKLIVEECRRQPLSHVDLDSNASFSQLFLARLARICHCFSPFLTKLTTPSLQKLPALKMFALLFDLFHLQLPLLLCLQSPLPFLQTLLVPRGFLALAFCSVVCKEMAKRLGKNH